MTIIARSACSAMPWRYLSVQLMPVSGRLCPSVPISVDLMHLMRSTQLGFWGRGTMRRTRQYTWLFLRRHSIACPGTSYGIPYTLMAPPKCWCDGTNSSMPTPPVFSYAQPACPNCSKSPSAYTRDLSCPRFSLSFAWTRARWIFRHLNSGHFNSPILSSKLMKPIVGLNVKCKTAAGGWTCMDLSLSIKKTENMKCGPQTYGMIRVRGQTLNKVTKLKYLVSLFRSDRNSLRDACTNTGGLRAFSMNAKLEDFSCPKIHTLPKSTQINSYLNPRISKLINKNWCKIERFINQN